MQWNEQKLHPHVNFRLIPSKKVARECEAHGLLPLVLPANARRAAQTLALERYTNWRGRSRANLLSLDA